MTQKRKAALITGASSGIGEVYALSLAKRRELSLVLTARREERLKELGERILAIWAEAPAAANTDLRIEVLPCDLSKQEERERLLADITKLDLQIDFLVNNAGFGSLGSFVDANLERQAEMIRLNVEAPVHLCHHFLEGMLQQNSGTIINVCSTAAYQPMPYMATYGATKSFLLSFTLALAAENQQSGLIFLAHCPGPTKSEFHLVVGLEDKLSFLPAMETEFVVEQALWAARHRKQLLINGRLNRALAALNRLFSKPAAARIVERILRRYSTIRQDR